ncbi:hypothetical protein ACQ856_18105 [Mycolicibacterium psychrotolerans]|uniref:hypothetical protein n=1 Tax=Mycolicibacterium psychrotolerans TaxID=216929 RepID=UPI003D663D65
MTATPAPETPCAACGCRYDEHCLICGCLTHKGDRDECLCAKFVAHVPTCPHCGHMFGQNWRLHVHLLPTPKCQSGARAAAGRHATAPTFEPPLKRHRAKYMAGAR